MAIRRFLLPLIAVCLVFAARPALAHEQPKKKPKNVVLFVVDDHGLQAGCYGDEVVKTPHLDALAKEGTRFTRAFCTTASCSASRSVILSGIHNHANGQYGHQHSYHHFAAFDTVQSLPVILANNGYRTCSIGKYHVAPESVFHFQKYYNDGVQGNRNSVRMAQNARRFIEEKDPRPFFLYFCTSDPHRGSGPGGFSNDKEYPGVTPVKYDPKDIVVPPWLPNQPEVKRELAEYYQAISRLDQGLGVLVKALKETGNWDNTLILYLSDNGPPFPGAKTTLYEPGMRLPLVVRLPGQQNAGGASDVMVNWADLAPTILEYCGVEHPAARSAKKDAAANNRRRPRIMPMQGRSFLSAIGNEKAKGPEEVYASHTFHEIQMYYPMRVIRTERFKYILNLAHQLPYPFASDLYASPTWQGVLKRGDSQFGRRSVRSYLQRPRHELFDLKDDPHETRNLADDPAHADALKTLQDKLKEWQQRTRDPWIVKYKYE